MSSFTSVIFRFPFFSGGFCFFCFFYHWLIYLVFYHWIVVITSISCWVVPVGWGRGLWIITVILIKGTKMALEMMQPEPFFSVSSTRWVRERLMNNYTIILIKGPKMALERMHPKPFFSVSSHSGLHTWLFVNSLYMESHTSLLLKTRCFWCVLCAYKNLYWYFKEVFEIDNNN